MSTPTTTTADYLMQIDPRLIEETPDQIREDATPDDALIQSVQRSGILQPPVVVYDEYPGNYRVVMGHRRVNAAKLAGLDEITVIVRDVADAAAELVDQINENEHRKGLSNAEISQGWANLQSMFGWTPEQIGEAVAEPVEKVAAGIRAQRSEKTRTIVTQHPAIDLEKAAILAEFDDNPKLQKELVEVAESRPGDFDWRLRNAREKVAMDARTAEVKAEIKAEGVKLAKTDQYGYLPGKAAKLENLVDGNGKKITKAKHKTCPGHAARVAGYRVEDLTTEYCCIDWAGNGHHLKNGKPAELTEEQKAAEAARLEAIAQRDANRAARRQWIHDLLPGKINQLAGVYEYMAAALTDNSGYYYDDHRSPGFVLPLLDVDLPASPSEASSTYDTLAASKRVAPFRLMLATALGIHEHRLERGRMDFIVRHLEQLERWGYTLTALDQDALAECREELAAVAAEEAEEAAEAAAASAGAGHDDDFADAGDTLRDQAHEQDDEDGESE